jgi:hypothetical protein
MCSVPHDDGQKWMKYVEIHNKGICKYFMYLCAVLVTLLKKKRNLHDQIYYKVDSKGLALAGVWDKTWYFDRRLDKTNAVSKF